MVCPRKCSMCTWEKCVFSCCQNTLHMFVRLTWFRMLFIYSFFYWFSVNKETLTPFECGELKSPTTMVLFFISSLSIVFVLHMSVLWCWTHIYLQLINILDVLTHLSLYKGFLSFSLPHLKSSFNISILLI